MEEEGAIEYIGSTIGKGVTFWWYKVAETLRHKRNMYNYGRF